MCSERARRWRCWCSCSAWVPVLLPAYLLIGRWLLIQLFSVWSGNNQPVAWWAHIGGFVAGAVLIVPFRYKQVPLFDGGLRR
jgi:membrane associated rhomboid family serine protease